MSLRSVERLGSPFPEPRVVKPLSRNIAGTSMGAPAEREASAADLRGGM